MLALLILAQVASATPAPSAAPAATPAAAAAPAPALGKASSAVQAKPKTLTDLAQERKLVKVSGGGTLSVAGASGMPAAPANTNGGMHSPSYPTENSRVRNAEADVKAARRALDDEAVRKGMTSEDAAAARRRLEAARRELSDAHAAAARSNN